MGVLYDPENLITTTLISTKRSLSTLSLERTPSPPEHTSSTLTPPHHAMAAVPFRWEESPGKPKPCKALAGGPIPVPPGGFADKSLELPPRLLLLQAGPRPCSYAGRSSTILGSSFRVVGGECYGSFRESTIGETAPFLSWTRTSCRAVEKKKKRGGPGSWKWGAVKGKKEVGGGSYVFPSDHGHGGEESVKLANITRVDSLTVLSQAARSHFWESIAEGLKQVVPWKNKRAKE